MTPIEKAAKEAATVLYLNGIIVTIKETQKAQEIITKHLTPIKDELDAKDKLLMEAREILEKYHYQICHTTMAKDWLARVKG